VRDFTESLIIQIWNAVYDYTIPFILDEALLGTGTLVTVDQATGVLTARHVASEIFKKRQGKPAHKLVFTALDRQASMLPIETQYLDWWCSEGTDNPWGPDLAFILLPSVGPFFSQLIRKKSFSPMSANPKRALNASKSRNRFAAVSGFVADKTKKGNPESGFPDVRRLQGYAFIGGPTHKRHKEKGYDFTDVD
jgi:hypothetical protein